MKFFKIHIIAFLSVLVAAGPVLAQDTRNLAATAEGGHLVFYASQYDDSTWKAAHLIDGSADTGWAGQSNGAQAVIIGFKDGRMVEVHDILINPYTAEDKTNWAKDVEIQLSSAYPFKGFQTAGKFTLRNEGQDQVFSLSAPARARYVKVIFHSNHGGSYMEAGEIQVMGRFLDDASPAPAYTNVAAAAQGGKIEKFTSQYNDTDWAAKNLLEDNMSRQWAGKSSGSQEIVVALPAPANITDIAISNYAREGSSNWAKDIEVEVSATSSYKDYAPVGKLSLPAVGDLHTLSLSAPAPARWVKILFRTNNGGSYMEASKIQVLVAEVSAQAGGSAAAKSIQQQLRESGRAVVHEIHFASNSAEILPDSEPALRNIAETLGQDPKLELIIEGHTDNVGGADFNLNLSRLRADAVKRWLADKAGISELRLTTIGYGLTKPIGDNGAEQGRALNRRVELVRK